MHELCRDYPAVFSRDQMSPPGAWSARGRHSGNREDDLCATGSLRIVYREEVQCAFSVDTAQTVHTVVTVDELTLCGDDQPGAYRFDGDVTSEQAMPKMESRERSVSASSRKPCQAAATAP